MSRLALAFACLVAFVLIPGVAGSAPARSQTSYTDRTGEAGRAPDIQTIAVANDREGATAIDIRLANRTGPLPAGEYLLVYLDADGNSASGAGSGLDFLVEALGAAPVAELRIYRWDLARREFTFDPSFAPAYGRDWGYSSSGSLYRFSFKRAVFNLAPTFRFVVAAESTGTGTNFDTDWAPDGAAPPGTETFSYRLDTQPPVVRAVASSGKRGKTAKLSYRVTDDSGVTQEKIRILRGSRVLATVSTTPGPATPGKSYFVNWKVPKSLKKGALRFCVTSTDEAGFASKASCATLKIT